MKMDVLSIQMLVDKRIFYGGLAAKFIHMHELDLRSCVLATFQGQDCLELFIWRPCMGAEVDETSRNHAICRDHHHYQFQLNAYFCTFLHLLASTS